MPNTLPLHVALQVVLSYPYGPADTHSRQLCPVDQRVHRRDPEREALGDLRDAQQPHVSRRSSKERNDAAGMRIAAPRPTWNAAR
jgi:hypothetical protein